MQEYNLQKIHSVKFSESANPYRIMHRLNVDRKIKTGEFIIEKKQQ